MLGLSALALGLAAATPLDTVSFHFGWPDGLRSRVELVRTRSRAGQPASELTLRARLVAETRGDQIRVGFRDWTGPGTLDPLVEAGGKVTTVVTREGTFVRVDEIEPALAALQARMAGLKGAPADAMDRLQRMAPALFAKDASETWSMLVQIWKGQSFEVGEDYASDSEVPVAALPNEKVRLHATFRVARRVTCPGGHGSCVEAHMSSRPEPQDVERVVKRFIGELGMPAAQAAQMLGEISATTDVALVTEPARLVPHRLERTRTTRVEPGQGAPKDAKTLEGKDVTVYTFSYAPEAAR